MEKDKTKCTDSITHALVVGSIVMPIILLIILLLFIKKFYE
jgi:multisubunit Na+/H+ antiporter MnhC subunit